MRSASITLPWRCKALASAKRPRSSPGSCTTSHCAAVERVVEAAGLEIDLDQQERGVGIERLPAFAAQGGLGGRQIVVQAEELAEEQTGLGVARLELERAARLARRIVEPVLLGERRGQAPVQEGGGLVLGDRALVGGERLVDLAVEHVLLGDEQVVVGRRVRTDLLIVRRAVRGAQPEPRRSRAAASAPSAQPSAKCRRRIAHVPRYPFVLEVAQDGVHALIDRLAVRIEHQFRAQRRLVGRGDAGELRDLARRAPSVEALHVAPLAGLDARVDEDLDELARGHQRAHRVAIGPIRRDERREDDQAGVAEQLRHLADAADVLGAVGGEKPRFLLRPWRMLSPSST